MRFYLVQHGEAKAETEDPERSLTERGIEEVKRISRKVKAIAIHPAKIYHSGKMRAKQTAETLANGLKPFNVPVESVQGLNPNDDIRPWASRIFKENEDLMIVGHLPFLEKLCSFLLAGDENGRLVLFRYGAIVCLEQKEDKRWAVTWVLTPEMTTSQ